MDALGGFPRFGHMVQQSEGPFTWSSISGPFVVAVSRVTGLDSEIAGLDCEVKIHLSPRPSTQLIRFGADVRFVN